MQRGHLAAALNQSDYLLTGLLRCAQCGKRLVGAAANGNGGRYMYYVCFTRHRYGTRVCNADRLPAEQLDAAILEQVTAALAHESFVRDAIQDAFAELDAAQPEREAEVATIDEEMQRTNAALDRYFAAFENGTMPEQACSQRITDLNAKLAGLRARRAELVVEDDENPTPPSEEALRELQASVRDVIRDGDPPARLSCRHSCTRSGWYPGKRSTRPSLCRWFDHRCGQYRHGDSNPGFRRERAL